VFRRTQLKTRNEAVTLLAQRCGSSENVMKCATNMSA